MTVSLCEEAEVVTQVLLSIFLTIDAPASLAVGFYLSFCHSFTCGSTMRHGFCRSIFAPDLDLAQ
jgi:hypothetical protein